jgi:AcrR family transcriptional regulator
MPMRRGEATRLRLQRVALELFVEKGVRETTIRDIAAGAGVAEGALYRHYESKEALAEALFDENYTAMANELSQISASGGGLHPTITEMVRFFCRSFDRDWVLFSYLLLSQHRHLRQRPTDRPSPASVLKAAIVEAMVRGEIPERDPGLLTAMVMGMVLQPAVARIYGRLEGKLADHEEVLAAACWRVLGAT